MGQRIILPPKDRPFAQAADVTARAELCLRWLHLEGWSFGFDRAVRRLGCCTPTDQRITLSTRFVAVYLEKDEAQIERTLRHELAHALAWVHHRERGHGAVWKAYCAALGIPGERAATKEVKAEEMRPARPTRYILCHKETGEIFRRYVVRPRHTAAYFRRCYIPGRRAETLGMLVLREVSSAPRP